MNVYELEKQATSGPLIVSNDCCGYSALAMTEMGENVFGGCGDKGDANVRFAAHCRNNFMHALEALKEIHGDVGPLWLKKLIAELEEV